MGFRRFRYTSFLYRGLIVLLFFSGCGSKHMIMTDAEPTFETKPGMALLVVVRTTSSIGSGQVFDTYLDGKMIGQTAGKGFFMADVDPGSHYVMAHAQNWVTARLNYEAGRVYFLNQGVIYSVPTVRTGFASMPRVNALKHINESNSDHLVYDKSNPGAEMPSDLFEQLKKTFEQEVRENPNRHRDTLEYEGYSGL